MNPMIIEVLLKEQRQDMLQEAERLRLVKLYEANNPKPRGRLLVALGNLLIRLGQRLKHRYEQQVELSGKICKSDHPA